MIHNLFVDAAACRSFFVSDISKLTFSRPRDFKPFVVSVNRKRCDRQLFRLHPLLTRKFLRGIGAHQSKEDEKSNRVAHRPRLCKAPRVVIRKHTP